MLLLNETFSYIDETLNCRGPEQLGPTTLIISCPNLCLNWRGIHRTQSTASGIFSCWTSGPTGEPKTQGHFGNGARIRNQSKIWRHLHPYILFRPIRNFGWNSDSPNSLKQGEQ